MFIGQETIFGEIMLNVRSSVQYFADQNDKQIHINVNNLYITYYKLRKIALFNWHDVLHDAFYFFKLKCDSGVSLFTEDIDSETNLRYLKNNINEYDFNSDDLQMSYNQRKSIQSIRNAEYKISFYDHSLIDMSILSFIVMFESIDKVISIQVK